MCDDGDGCFCESFHVDRRSSIYLHGYIHNESAQSEAEFFTHRWFLSRFGGRLLFGLLVLKDDSKFI